MGLHSFSWFDKPLTLAFTNAGRGAVHMEHSWGDGMSMLYPINSAYADTIASPAVRPDTVPAVKDSANDVTRLGRSQLLNYQ